jgi:hypothetical protein
MKRFFFLLAMLISLAASATVTVTPISVDYPNKKVTFRIAWTGTPTNNRVWVWVDLCPVVGTSPSTFAKAVISAATGSGVVAGTLNGRGFYVNTSGATITATLSNATGKFNWCAYGSDFPPNAIQSSSVYNLKGSSPFIITTASTTTEVSANTYTGSEIIALTDATGCPGILCGKNGEASGLLNCCVPGTTNCSGTCKTDELHYENGDCSNVCTRRWRKLVEPCGTVVNPTVDQITDVSCASSTCTVTCDVCNECCAGWNYSTIRGNRCECDPYRPPHSQSRTIKECYANDGAWFINNRSGNGVSAPTKYCN